jgi:hypothetical protein
MIAPGTINEWQPPHGPVTTSSLIQRGSIMTYGSALRRDVHGDSITPLIGVFDMFSASLAARAVQRTRVGRGATEPMRADIRLLGTILGDTVREQNGDEVFDLVERARVESFRVRRSEIDRAEMSRMFDGIDIHLAIPIIRAFSHFALLANVAEDIHRNAAAAFTSPANRPRTAAWPPLTRNSIWPSWIRPASPTPCRVRWCPR